MEFRKKKDSFTIYSFSHLCRPVHKHDTANITVLVISNWPEFRFNPHHFSFSVMYSVYKKAIPCGFT